MKPTTLLACAFLSCVTTVVAKEDQETRSTLVEFRAADLFGKGSNRIDHEIPALGPGFCYDVTDAFKELLHGVAIPNIAIYNPDSGWLYASGTEDQLLTVQLGSHDFTKDVITHQIPRAKLVLRVIEEGDHLDAPIEHFSMSVLSNPSSPSRVQWGDVGTERTNLVEVDMWSGSHGAVEIALTIDINCEGTVFKTKTRYSERKGVDHVVATAPRIADGKTSTLKCIANVEAGWKAYEIPELTEARRKRIEAIETTLKEAKQANE